MKTSLKSCMAGLAGIVLTGSLHAATITHFDIDFDDYTPGPITSGGALSITSLSGEIVEASEGENYLSLTGSDNIAKSLRVSTATSSSAGTQSLLLGASTSYQWSFSFQLPTTMAPILIRLDDGSASNGSFITGIYISATGQLSYMTNPNIGTLGSQMTAVSTSEFQISADTWYDVTFDITTGEANGDGTLPVSYALHIEGGGDTFDTEASYVPSGSNSVSAARAIWGTASNSQPVNLRLDNLYLATIPEPGTVSLIIGTAFLGLAFRKKLLRRK